tara:strand:- start:12 stop:161 length:150 start_codon:yes stop_codon:yes gene_type:complete
MIEKLEFIEKILANIMCSIEDEDIYLDLSEVLQIIDAMLQEIASESDSL